MVFNPPLTDISAPAFPRHVVFTYTFLNDSSTGLIITALHYRINSGHRCSSHNAPRAWTCRKNIYEASGSGPKPWNLGEWYHFSETQRRHFVNFKALSPSPIAGNHWSQLPTMVETSGQLSVNDRQSKMTPLLINLPEPAPLLLIQHPKHFFPSHWCLPVVFLSILLDDELIQKDSIFFNVGVWFSEHVWRLLKKILRNSL